MSDELIKMLKIMDEPPYQMVCCDECCSAVSSVVEFKVWEDLYYWVCKACLQDAIKMLDEE